MVKRLYRSNHNRVIAGVCGGISEYFQIDPSLVRILFILTGMFGAGLLVYIVAMFIMPKEEDVFRQGYRPDENEWGRESFDDGFEKYRPEPKFSAEKSKLVIGVGFILFGVIFLFKQLFPWFHMDFFWPLLIIAIGLFLIFKR